MAQGKFSNPRPHRDEDRQIEEAFRQVTGQQVPTPQRRPVQKDSEPDLLDLLNQLPEESTSESAIPSENSFENSASRESRTWQRKFMDFLDDTDGTESDLSEDSDFSEDEMEDELPVWQRWLNVAMDYFNNNRKVVLAGLCAVALLLIVGVIVIFAVSADPYDGKILDNVYLGDIAVGGMTKAEAAEAIKLTTAQTYAKEDMVIDLSGTELHLTPSDTAVTVDAKAAAQAAFDYGRTGTKAENEQAYASSKTEQHIIGLLPYLQLNEEYVRSFLSSYASDTGSTLTQASYGLEGEEPELSADKFDKNAPAQTLVITMGTPGVGFDPSSVYTQVLDAYSLHQFLVTVEAVDEVVEPEPVDLEKIYEEFYIEPVNATVDLQTFETIPGSYGYDFDKDAAQKLIDAAQYGDEVRIPMRYIEPEILDEDSFYQDVLGEYQTKHTTNENRNTNLRLACEAINGVVLNPGDTFSFNDTLGQRTSQKGYKPAPAYSGNELVDELGGGICQVSSTLYYTTLLADLEIVSRTNHGFVPTYIDYGMDATVSWKTPDFSFRNSTNFPIKIQAEVSDGYVKVQLLGTDERDYYVKMEYKITATQEPEIEYLDFEPDNKEGYKDGDVIEEGTTGYTVKTYKLKYNNQNNELISRDFEATSQYKMVKKVVARVKVEETTQPTEETTVPTTAPTETTAPPTAPTETTTPSTPPTETTKPTDPTPTTEAPAPTEAPPPTESVAAPGEEGENLSVFSWPTYLSNTVQSIWILPIRSIMSFFLG